MEWTRTRDDDTVTEWEREDGYATTRIREKPNGSFAVRLDVLIQADEEDRYEYETVDRRTDAGELVDRWKAELA